MSNVIHTKDGENSNRQTPKGKTIAPGTSRLQAGPLSGNSHIQVNEHNGEIQGENEDDPSVPTGQARMGL